MTTEHSIPEDADTNSDVIDFSLPPGPALRPTVPDEQGNERPLTDYEMRRVEESAADSAMRRQAASAQQGSSTIDRQMAARPRAGRPLDENAIYQFALSPSIHEQRVLSLVADEHDDALPYLGDATDFLRSTRTVLEKIDTAYKGLMLDKSLTPDARSIKLEAATSKAFTAAFAKRGAAVEALVKKIAYTEGELNTPMTTAAATPRSNELRTVLRSMKAAEVNEAIRNAITAEHRSPQQQELLSATLGAHALTVGISEQEQALHVRAYNEKTQPQIQRRLDLLKKALQIVDSVKPETLRSQFEGSMRSAFSRATNIRGISEKAQAALDAINAK